MNKKTKDEAIAVALAKLTQEEQELLGLIKKPKKLRVKKNYKLVIDYMIGDADGYTKEEATISLANPFVDLLVGALDKLVVPDGYWGIGLSNEAYSFNLKNKKITQKEFDLLCLVSNYNYDEEENGKEFLETYGYGDSDENHEFLSEFEGLLVDDAEYSFLVYQGYTLK